MGRLTPLEPESPDPERRALQPNAVEERHFEVLKRYYSKDRIAEIVAVITRFGFLNRWNDTIRTDIEDFHAA